MCYLKNNNWNTVPAHFVKLFIPQRVLPNRAWHQETESLGREGKRGFLIHDHDTACIFFPPA